MASERSLCLLIDKNDVFLAPKKREGFGTNKLNGYGGNKEDNESIEECACRETREESGGVIVNVCDLYKQAEINFYFDNKPEWNQTVHVFVVEKYSGIPQESEEMMAPERIAKSKLLNQDDSVYERMWVADKLWIPLVLSGRKVKAEVTYANGGEYVKEHKITIVEKF